MTPASHPPLPMRKTLAIAVCLVAFAPTAHAQWLQARDQNPFALATGLPLPPAAPSAGWQLDATFHVANTELAQQRGDSALVFDAETRETRVAFTRAFDERWSLRVSLGHVAIGDGVFDGAISDFHRAFGFDNGDRDRLGTQAPFVEVRDGDRVLRTLTRGRSGAGPTLVDLTRRWDLGDTTVGLTLGTKLATGNRAGLADSGSHDVSASGFVEHALGERWTVAARAGVLYQSDNTLLEDRAREVVPFAGAAIGYRLGERWRAIVQADAHAELYRDLPGLFGAANLLSFGLSRDSNRHGTFFMTLAEDVPRLRTTDVVLQLGWRLHGGR